MSTSDVIALLILLSGVVGGAWIIYFKLAQKIDDLDDRHDAKIKRVYQRQDEEIKVLSESQRSAVDKIEKEFMRVDAHKLSMEHIKEIMDIKSNAIIQLFTSQLADLTGRVKELIDRMNGKEKNA